RAARLGEAVAEAGRSVRGGLCFRRREPGIRALRGDLGLADLAGEAERGLEERGAEDFVDGEAAHQEGTDDLARLTEAVGDDLGQADDDAGLRDEAEVAVAPHRWRIDALAVA